MAHELVRSMVCTGDNSRLGVDHNEFVTVVTIKVSLRRELNRYLERLALTAVEPSVASVGDFLRQLPPHRNHI